jgi:hypothetical protein
MYYSIKLQFINGVYINVIFLGQCKHISWSCSAFPQIQDKTRELRIYRTPYMKAQRGVEV